MFRPFFRLSKEMGGVDVLPYIAPIPRAYRRFACFVIAESDDAVFLGSGTITNIGIITAAHIFAFDFNKIEAVVYADDCHLVTIPIPSINIETGRDIAYLYGVVPRYSQPCLIPRGGMKIEKDKCYAFGCPQGIFGLTWKPNVVSHTKDWIVSRGVLIPGISGGGIYYRHGDKWYIVAVHSWGYLDSKTLYSARLV